MKLEVVSVRYMRKSFKFIKVKPMNDKIGNIAKWCMFLGILFGVIGRLP